MPTLFTPLKVGRMDLSTRVFLPPMTRTRSNPLTLVPGADVAKYYGDRASPGVLLVTEAIYISPETIGLPHAPGIWTPDQVAGWKQVTAAVHAKGGYIYAQLWHVGRIAHPSFGEHPLVKGSGYTTGRSASDVPLEREPAILLGGKRGKHVAPTPFTLEEIERLKRDYGTAAKNAIEAGFDGVELHAAHGYLIDQFLNSGTNKRTDRYGGSIENRVRLLDEVLASLVSAAGADRVAVRLSPHTNTPASALQGMSDPAPAPLYTAAIAAAAKHQLAYLLLTEPRLSFRSKTLEDDLKLAAIPVTVGTNWAPVYRSEFTKAAAAAGASVGTARGGAVVFGAGGFTPMSGALAVSEGIYDGVGIGRWWIANPDLIERIRLGLPLNKYNRALFYVASQEGYNDYPTFTEACEQLGADPSLFATPSTSIVPHAAPAHGAAAGLVFGAKEGSEGVYGSPGACEQRAQQLVALAEGKLKYGLATIGSIGASTSLAQAQAQAQARRQEEKLVAKM